MTRRRVAGFAFAPLVLALPLCAYLLWIGTSRSSSARVRAQERAAIDTLRSIASAQAQLVSRGAIDTDADGVGEFGFFGELAGSAPLRVYNATTGSPALEPNGLGLSPPLLPAAFSNLSLTWFGEAELERNGYRFKMYLPRATIAGHVAGIPETGPSGIGGATAAFMPNPDNGELLWACYAWPDEGRAASKRAFFLDQEGRLLQTSNNPRSPRTMRFYEGWGGGPAYDAAYSDLPGPRGVTGMGALPGNRPRTAHDGNLWTRAR